MTDKEKMKAFKGQACKAANLAGRYADQWESEFYKERIPPVPDDLMQALTAASLPQMKGLPVLYKKVESALKEIQETLQYVRVSPEREDLTWDTLRNSARTIFESVRELNSLEASEGMEKPIEVKA